MNQDISLPALMKDDSESMKYEEMIDFFLSWTIRCADDAYKETHIKIFENARRVLNFLMDDIYFNQQNMLSVSVTDIKVWKQYWNIDLWVELVIDNKKHVIIIENKMYSKLTCEQLNKYRQWVDEFYQKKQESNILHFVVIRPDYEHQETDANVIKNSKYKYTNLDEIKGGLYHTDHPLFDEFWFNW